MSSALREQGLISLGALGLAAMALAAFLIIAIKGTMEGVNYPNFPHWFSLITDGSFYVSLVAIAVAFVGMKVDRNKKISHWALGLSTLTVFLVAWCTTAN
jgi:uncharacterized membrane protein YhdT